MNIRCICGQYADPSRGVFLERLYPAVTWCRGCGRRQLFCDCARPALDVGDGPTSLTSDIRGRTEQPEDLAA